MKVYLVYELIHRNNREWIDEHVEFYGAFYDRKKAIDRAKERVKIGREEYDVEISKDEEKRGLDKVFTENSCIYMYRKDDMDEVIYSIDIQELEMEGEKRYE